MLVVAAGCGRLGFDGAAPSDGAVDADDSDIGGPGDDAPQEVTCSPAFDICDGFEDGLDTALWTVHPAATLDTSFAHRGNNSIRIHTDAFGAGQQSYRMISETRTLAANPTAFWVRGWFYLSALPAGGNGMELITAQRPGNEGDYVFVFRNRTTVYSQYSGASREAPAPAPVGSWFCAVFEIVRSTTTNGSLALTGDLPAIDLNDTATDSATQPMVVVTLGAAFSSANVSDAQPAFDLWIDDVIVHRAPVSCSD